MGRKRRRGGDGGGMEENTMAILDTSCFSKSTQHVADDRLSFHEAVRSGFLVPENAFAPTNKMYKAIFQIFKFENSLDLIMSSYQLLLELDKRFPRVYSEKSESFSSSSLVHNELLVVEEEAWSPFAFSTDVSFHEVSESLDATAFHLIIQDLAKVPDEANNESLRNMLLFQYLVNVLEGDFVPRNLAFTENSDWIILRESVINMILVSRKITYKGLIKDCLYAMCELFRFSTDSNIALPEVVKRTCCALQNLLLMIIELDSSKKAADNEGLTTRADGVRIPVIDIILDELTYDKDLLFPFFQALDKPKLKLDMIVQYLRKYLPKTSGRTSRFNGSTSDSTFGEVLKCFSNGNNTKSIIKKISAQVAQMLLAHAFQAYILLPSQNSTNNSLPELCKNMISAFTCLKKTDQHTGILPFGKEALFTAAIMLSGA